MTKSLAKKVAEYRALETFFEYLRKDTDDKRYLKETGKARVSHSEILSRTPLSNTWRGSTSPDPKQ